MTGPGISVVICVYTEDRWEDILAAVSSVRAQSCPALETLLVVDHNPALLARLERAYEAGDGVRVLANAGPRGLSAGRNTGIAASRGEVIAFLDDDAVAERDWLRRFTEGYADPRVLAVGGRTEPVWASGRRPDWFPEEFDWVVGCTYQGLPPGRVRVRNVLGGNASFRRTAFEAAGGFATGIGRDGDRRPLGCEETELCIRLSRARPDAVLLIDDRAVIHHRVPASREHFAYFRSRTYAEGLSKALVARSVGADKGLESERRYVTRVLPAGVARGIRDALLGRPGGAGRAGAIVAGALGAAGGYALGSLRARRAAGTPYPAPPAFEPTQEPAGEPTPAPAQRPSRATDREPPGRLAQEPARAPAEQPPRGPTQKPPRPPVQAPPDAGTRGIR
ncbi:glycosyltransferase [Streptomyces sp. NPDC028722]|uniref:glycosyltransferase n=1 Tax=Streptomyces sp. NPDC028722 TaxID=3155016 RepID=UPI0033FED375